MAEVAQIRHRLPGRVRMRVVARKGDAAFFERVARELEKASCVVAVRVSPPTAGLLVFYEGPMEAFVHAALDVDLRVVETPPPVAAHSPLTAVAHELSSLEEQLRQNTEGRWGLGALAFYGLLGGSVVQALRGRYLPAASSLLSESLRVLGEAVEAERRARESLSTRHSV